MACERAMSVLHGYFDGELDAAGAREFEQHLPSCAECAAALKGEEDLRSSLQRSALYESAPAGLKRKVRASLGAGARPAATIPFWGTFQGLLAGAASLAVLVGIVFGLRLMLAQAGRGDTPELDATIVDAHLRSLQPGHLTDVVSTDQHTVKPWFAGKIDFSPAVTDFQAEGFPLQGGRLDVIQGRSVAVVVYARRKHLINVFIWPTAENDSGPSSGSLYGYHWMRWRKDKMEMWAVSDVNSADLGQLQSLLAR